MAQAEGMGSTYRPDHNHLPEKLFAFPVSEEDSEDPGEGGTARQKKSGPLTDDRTVSLLTHVIF